MAKRSCRDYEATLEQQMKQFKPVRGEAGFALPWYFLGLTARSSDEQLRAFSGPFSSTEPLGLLVSPPDCLISTTLQPTPQVRP